MISKLRFSKLQKGDFLITGKRRAVREIVKVSHAGHQNSLVGRQRTLVHLKHYALPDKSVYYLYSDLCHKIKAVLRCKKPKYNLVTNFAIQAFNTFKPKKGWKEPELELAYVAYGLGWVLMKSDHYYELYDDRELIGAFTVKNMLFTTDELSQMKQYLDAELKHRTTKTDSNEYF